MSGVGWKADTSWPLKHKSIETCKYVIPADVTSLIMNYKDVNVSYCKCARASLLYCVVCMLSNNKKKQTEATRLAPFAGNSFCNGYIDHESLRMRKGEKNKEDFIVTSCSLPILPLSHPHPFSKTGHWRLRTRLQQDLREHKISQKSWWIQAALNDVRCF